MKDQELITRFTYHAPTIQKAEMYEDLRKRGLNLAIFIEGTVPDCREKELAITKLEEVIMWANAGIARR